MPSRSHSTYQRLIDEIGLTPGKSLVPVSEKRSTITNSLRLLKLSPEIQELTVK